MAWDSALERTEPRSLGDVLDALELEVPSPRSLVVKFANPDIAYLTRTRELQAKFTGRMLGWFGEPVVLEALRRFEKGWTEAVFVGICRQVERAGV
jgi:hypothetical protein